MIRARLTATLEKLRRPLVTPERYVDLDAWWEAIGARYPNPGIDFERGTVGADERVPGSLFDHVVDNLLHNALAKRNANPAVRIRVTLDAADGGACLRIEDTGARSAARGGGHAAARPGALGQRAGDRPVPGGAPGGCAGLSPRARGESRRCSTLCAPARSSGQYARRSEPAVEQADRDPHRHVVVFTPRRGVRVGGAVDEHVVTVGIFRFVCTGGALRAVLAGR